MTNRRPQAESEDLEIKSRFTKGHQDRGTLVKTIVAMANTRGGRIILESITCDPKELDSARLDDLVNKYTKPRVANLVSVAGDDDSIEIRVQESETKPHIFNADLQFQDSGKTRTAFHPGQVWVRHSSKNEPATEDDVDRMIRDRAARFLGDLSVTIRNPDFPLRLTDSEGMPIRVTTDPDAQAVALDGLHLDQDGKLSVRLTDDEGAPAVSIDVNRQYPYTTRGLAQQLGTNQNWVAGAVGLLQLKDSPVYHQPIRNSRGVVIADLYSEATLDRLRGALAENPDWNPWGEWCRRRGR